MIAGLFIILLCQLAGEFTSRSLGWPIPGPVLGMGLMFLGLWLSARLRNLVKPVAETILGNLILLFVPAGVGAALQLGALKDDALVLIFAVIASTLLAIVAGTFAFIATAKLTGQSAGGSGGKA